MKRFASRISVVLFSCSGTVLAAPTITYDEGAFLAESPITIVESFDTPMTFPKDQRTITFGQVQITSVDTDSPPYWVVDPSSNPPLLRRFSEGSSTMDLRIDFENAMSTPAFGLHLVPFGYPSQFEVLIESSDGSSTSVMLASNTAPVYLGIADPQGIRSIVLTQHPELAAGVSTNFGLSSFARSDLSSGSVTTRPKISAWSVALERTHCAARGAAMALNAESTSDGVLTVHPELGTPVAVWKAEGYVALTSVLERNERHHFHGVVICMANMGPAAAFTSIAEPDVDLWEVRAREHTPSGVRYRSYLAQDGEVFDYFGYEPTPSDDADCGHPSDVAFLRQTWGDIDVQDPVPVP